MITSMEAHAALQAFYMKFAYNNPDFPVESYNVLNRFISEHSADNTKAALLRRKNRDE